MLLVKSRLQFWLLLFLALNVLGLVLMAVKSEGMLSASPFQLFLGFILQLPAIALCASIDALIIAFTSRFPLSVVFRFIGRFIFLYLFLLLYLASIVIYLGVGVFISIEVISIFFLDFTHIMPLLITTALIPVLLLTLLDLLLFLPLNRLPFFTLPSLNRILVPVFALWMFLFCSAAIFSLIQIQRDHPFYISVTKNTFPSTFLLGQLLDRLSHSAEETSSLDIKPLEKQISMAGYRAFAGELKTKPPVILIMLESVSYDHLGFTGYRHKDITPNLDTLFKQSVFFDRTYTPSNHSNLSQGSILSSQYSLRRIRLETFQDVNFVKPMLFDILHEYGYETALYSAQNEDWLGMRRFLEANDAQIDHFKHALDFPDYFTFYDKKMDDADLITEAGKYLTEVRDSAKPLMLYLNLQRTHYDYRLKPDVDGHFGQADSQITGIFFDYGEHQVEKALLQYDNALYYVDQQLGRFFDELKQQGLYDDALIIVTADHGEAFYENGYATHATSMYDAQIRTFMSVKLPNQNEGVYRKDVISSIDMLPIALEALGLPNHPAFQGYQLLHRERTATEPVFSTGQSVVRADAVIQYPWKYFVSEKEGAVLINLQTDPTEQENLLLKERQIAKKMQRWLSQYRLNQLEYYRYSDQAVRDTYYAPKYDFSTSLTPAPPKTRESIIPAASAEPSIAR